MTSRFPTGLAPEALWQRFADICAIPHGSGNEAALRQYLKTWAEGKGLQTVVDETGNLLIRVPATPGREGVATTVLQGHIDMVCEKNADVDFDFATDGLQVDLDGEWITANGTTLGADNGVGAAAALALVDDPEAVHGPLEILLTIDEETGMTGAWGLAGDFLSGHRMINLDTEEEASVYVGCSGGGDVIARFPMQKVPCPGGSAFELRVMGLLGGHSGLDIHENRANAIKCMGRVLERLLSHEVGFHLSSIGGGSMRNAIPREAACCLCVPDDQVAAFRQVVAAEGEVLATEFNATDPGLQVVIDPVCSCSCEQVFSQDMARSVVGAIMACPSNVVTMSRDVPGLVETSNNLGVVTSGDDTVEVICCSRSSVLSALEAVRYSLRCMFTMAGAEVELDEAYPGWQPNMKSPLLAHALDVHQQMFAKPAEVKAVHAGLECGLLGMRYPGMDMISIGPDIRGAHSPDERVHVESTARFYAHLKGILAALD